MLSKEHSFGMRLKGGKRGEGAMNTSDRGMPESGKSAGIIST